jgi:hypothetical protein
MVEDGEQKWGRKIRGRKISEVEEWTGKIDHGIHGRKTGAVQEGPVEMVPMNGSKGACAAAKAVMRGSDERACSPALLQSAALRWNAAACDTQGLRPGLTPEGRLPTEWGFGEFVAW